MKYSSAFVKILPTINKRGKFEQIPAANVVSGWFLCVFLLKSGFFSTTTTTTIKKRKKNTATFYLLYLNKKFCIANLLILKIALFIFSCFHLISLDKY